MNRREHLLVCLSEECAEVSKEISKALRFSLDEKYVKSDFTNRERIQNELRDLFCVAQILADEGIINDPFMISADEVNHKRGRIHEYMEISRRYKVLQEL